MAAKARVVIGDQNSAEFDALRRSFNSLLVILQNIAAEQAAATTTAVQAAAALSSALSTGLDSSSAPHVGTGRMVYGVQPSPLAPARAAEEQAKLVDMTASSKF